MAVGLFASGTQKPALGAAQIDPLHPLGKDCIGVLLFNHPAPVIGITYAVPFIRGSGATGTTVPNAGPYRFLGQASTGPPTWVSSTEGLGVRIPGTNRPILASPNPSTSKQVWLPETAVTVCVIRRRIDTVARSATLVGLTSSTNPDRFNF